MVRAHPRPPRALSSAWSERFVDIEEVTGSNPVVPTMKVIYEDENIRVLDKPAGINADDIPLRIHRLDKDTSGVLLTAKNDETLEVMQKQVQNREVKKKYIALVVGNLKNTEGTVETLLGRSPGDRRKQKVFLAKDPEAGGKRTAITRYKLLQKFENYDLIEVEPLTGRKHQIRVHLAYLGHPIAGDKLYGFKNQIAPEGLKRQFLHAEQLEIKMPDGRIEKFESELPADLKLCLTQLKQM